MIVMKFGGSSLKNAERFKQAAKIIQNRLNQTPVVVLSATQGTTDLLINSLTNKDNFKKIKQNHLKIAKDLGIDTGKFDEIFINLEETINSLHSLKKVNPVILELPRLMGSVLSFGERLSVRLMSHYLKSIGVNSKYYDAWDMGMITDSNFGNAHPLKSTYKEIKSHFCRIKCVPIVTGFIGKNEQSEITTFSRGGSDFTAAIIANAIDAKTLEIWTDVNGILSTNPKIFSNAKTIEKLSFDEAVELSFFGAKVLHLKTIFPAIEKNIPIRILNSLNPKHNGTLIVKNSPKTNAVIKGVSVRKGNTMINVYSAEMISTSGYLGLLFGIFSSHNVSVDVVTTSTTNISTVLDETDETKILAAVNEIKKHFQTTVIKNMSIVGIVGNGLKENELLIAKILKSVADSGINFEVVSMGASKLNLTIAIKDKDAEKAVKLIHTKFIGQ